MLNFGRVTKILVALSLFVFVILPSSSLALVKDLQDSKLGLTRTEGDLENVLETGSADQNGPYILTLVQTLISTVLAVFGVIFFLLMLYGGVNWMLARGNDDMVGTAKNTIEAAVIGLIVVVGSYALTTFIMSTFERDESPQVQTSGVDAGPGSNNKQNSSKTSDSEDNVSGKCEFNLDNYSPGSFCTERGPDCRAIKRLNKCITTEGACCIWSIE